MLQGRALIIIIILNNFGLETEHFFTLPYSFTTTMINIIFDCPSCFIIIDCSINQLIDLLGVVCIGAALSCFVLWNNVPYTLLLGQ